jgi:hypothetical protein
VRWMPFLATAAVIATCSGLALSAQRGQAPAAATPPSNPKTEQYKKDLAAEVDSMKDFTQEMVDQVFSFGEPDDRLGLGRTAHGLPAVDGDVMASTTLLKPSLD